MSDTLIHDTAKVVSQVIGKPTENSHSTNWWMWLAIVEFVIIAFILLKEKLRGKETAQQKFKNESLKQEVDFNNIINSSFNSIALYDQLKVKCHPDRFATDAEKNLIADKLFQEITKNKTNVKRLIELKEEATQKLNIHF